VHHRKTGAAAPQKDQRRFCAASLFAMAIG